MVKINFWLLCEILERKFVILDSLYSFKEIFSLGTKLIKAGNNVNVITNDVIRPKVIIHPKSMIGFISLKIKDKKAIIVVRAVYKIGQNIFSVVRVIKSKIERIFNQDIKNLEQKLIDAGAPYTPGRGYENKN